MFVAVIILGSCVLLLCGAFLILKKKFDTTSNSLENSESQLVDMENQLEEAEQTNKHLRQEIQNLEFSNEEIRENQNKDKEVVKKLKKNIRDLKKEKKEIDAQLFEAEKKMVDLAARPDVILNEISENDKSNAKALWELELIRSERAWRNSVSTNPFDDVSPFESTDNPVQLVVEVEAAALREDVGALVSVDWRAGKVTDPSRSHLIVRVAQELLATASKSSEPAKLVIKGKDDLVISLEPETKDSEVNLIPPSIESDLLDINTEKNLTVTVKA